MCVIERLNAVLYSSISMTCTLPSRRPLCRGLRCRHRVTSSRERGCCSARMAQSSIVTFRIAKRVLVLVRCALGVSYSSDVFNPIFLVTGAQNRC